MSKIFTRIDLELEDLITGLSNKDKQDLVDLLVEKGVIPTKLFSEEVPSFEKNYLDRNWDEAVFKLLRSRLLLSNEDTESVLRIANKLI